MFDANSMVAMQLDEESKEVQKRKRTGKYAPHPDDLKILNRITDEKEFIKVWLYGSTRKYVFHMNLPLEFFFPHIF